MPAALSQLLLLHAEPGLQGFQGQLELVSDVLDVGLDLQYI